MMQPHPGMGYDLVVIGGGGAGATAATERRTEIVEYAGELGIEDLIAEEEDDQS